MRRSFAVPLFLAAALLLAACGGPPVPGGTPGSSETPAPTTTETAPTELPITRIMILTDIVHFGDELAWAADGFRYDDPHDLTIAKLTEAFGAEPTTDPSTPGQYDWGGFLLYFSTDPTLSQAMGVQVTVARIGGVEIFVGGEDIQVGTPWAEVEAAADRIEVHTVLEEVVEAQFDVVDLTEHEARFIAVYGAESGAVTMITGPITAGSID